VLPDYLRSRGVPFHIANQDTYSVVKRLIPEGKTMCSLCSRLRRGALYRVAGELGATKIALGHHRDDILQTFFMNLFFGAKLKAMPPKLGSDDGRHIVIRPLAYVPEADLERWAAERAFPIIPCTLCGNQPNLQRVRTRAMLNAWEREFPGRLDNIFRALGDVVPSHLADRELFAFAALRATGVADPGGDRAFDEGLDAIASQSIPLVRDPPAPATTRSCAGGCDVGELARGSASAAGAAASPRVEPLP
jgi:tRNA 2-thiocytidine biosynthesis protein TtcA